MNDESSEQSAEVSVSRGISRTGWEEVIFELGDIIESAADTADEPRE